MIEFAEIAIEDKALFDKYLKIYNPQASELTFTNLFMWRNFYKFRYTVVGNLLCIIAVPEHADPYAFMPVGDISKDALKEAVERLQEYFTHHGWKLKFGRVTEEETTYFKDFVNTENDVVFDRDNSDYIYLAENLTYLKGKKFDGKRNHINKFKKLYQYEYTALAQEHMDACYRIMDEWCAERNCDDHKEFYCEKAANTEVLKNYDKLGCEGALVMVDGKFEAFTVGEMLNNDTAVIHIEKANSKVNGLYTFINQQFCEHEWQGATYVNREQDLGKEGLRKAKLSYNPVKIVGKYTVHVG